MTKISFFLYLSLFISSMIFAQEGTISGTVTDPDGEPLPFANILIIGTERGTQTDFEGRYRIALEEGIYSLQFSFVGHQTVEIIDINLGANKDEIVDVTLEYASLKEVVVEATTRKNNEASVLTMQRKSVNLVDAISLQSIKKSGSTNVAQAIKRVPGVSLQGGKFVYVRGLGDRYTKSILNGVDIPGLDPDRNTLQMDIFPSSILENIVVSKSASADLPADFTGGVVNVVTKDFPTRKQFEVNVSGTFNPNMHFQDNYLNYEGSTTDFLGFDSGDRKLPLSGNTVIPDPVLNDPSLTTMTQSFSPILAAQREDSPMNFGLGFNYGNRHDIGGDDSSKTLGYFASIDYKNRTTFYEGFENGTYLKNPDNSVTELISDRTQLGDQGINNVLLSGLAGISYKTERSKYKLNVLHIQNGESRAALFNQKTDFSNVIDVVKHNLEYTQRSVSNLSLSGKHKSESANFTTEWVVSPTLSRAEDKDVRLTTFIDNGDGTFGISSDAGFPDRIWRDLEEINIVGKVDFTKKYLLNQKDAKLKFGAYGTYKKRDYSISSFFINFRNFITASLNGDPDQILANQNVWTAGTGSGSYIDGNFEPSNTFESNQNVAAGYISNEFNVTEKFKAIVGLRAEMFNVIFTGQNNAGNEVFDEEKVIDELDLFPSANLIYKLDDKTNVRLSYSKTTARPSFKEVSVVQIQDVLTGRTFIGNPDLTPSYSDNIDFRLEFFGEKSQLLALSSFYKFFKDPIELVAFSASAVDNFQPRNAPKADVYGIELETRKNLGFITPALENLNINVNASFIRSVIEMSNAEFDSRLNNARNGENIDNTRTLQGQSPFLINAGLSYQTEESGIQTGLFYNVQGRTLQVVGINASPDVFTLPFNSLDFTFSKTFGENDNSKISLKVANILDSKVKSIYDSFGSVDEIFSERSLGQAISLGYSYKF